MTKPTKKQQRMLAELAVTTAWFFLLSWLLNDVPAPWHLLATFVVFYLSRLCTLIGQAVKAAIEVLGE